MTKAQYLIIGLGSVGRRHARNLRLLGCSVSGFDPRPDRISEALAEGSLAQTFSSLEDALATRSWRGVVIGSPTALHVPQILEVCTQSSALVLSEKPLGTTYQQASALKPFSERILLGYTYRWWPPLVEFRRWLQGGELGPLRSLRVVMSAHLADWHPWERYQDFFMAHQSLGGGALLDESHFIDLALWFGIRPLKLAAFVERVSELEIDTDDHVDLLIQGAGGEQLNLHLDIHGRPHERSVVASCERGSLRYLYETNTLSVWLDDSEVLSRKYDCERNQMFEAAAREFVECVEGGRKQKTCTVEDGLSVLAVVDAARSSSAEGRFVPIDR